MKIFVPLLLILISMTDGFLDIMWNMFNETERTEINNTINKFPNLANNLAKLDIIGLIKAYGYPAENHTVTTSDGFFLEMHRIKNGKTNPKPKPYPVLLMHGMACNSGCYLTNDKNSLAFVLADQGYDVWLGNFRGNSFSAKHKSLNITSKEYWDHSWHEMGVIDTPAMIDYILEVTKKKKLFHMGHSMGGGTFYVMTSSKPEYNNKIAAHFSMGPATFLSQTNNKFYKFLAGKKSYVEMLFNLIGFKYFPFDAPLMKKAASKFCASDAMSKLFCIPIFLVLGGMESRKVNTSLFPLFLKYTPDKISTKVMIHFLQSVKHGQFSTYDSINKSKSEEPGKPWKRKPRKGKNKKVRLGKRKEKSGKAKGKLRKGKKSRNCKEKNKINKTYKKGMKNDGKNKKKTGKNVKNGPVPYDLKKVTAPVFILNGDADDTVTNKDAQKLFDQIGSKTKEFIRIKDNKYGHIDHIWNINAKQLAYDLILKKMGDILKTMDNEKTGEDNNKDNRKESLLLINIILSLT